MSIDMTAKNKAVFHSRGSARHFLFSKTTTGRLQDISHKQVADTRKLLQSAYPDMLCDQDFRDHAQQVLASDSLFSAVVIQLDRNGQEEAASDDLVQDDGLLEVARLLDDLCRAQNGIWGALESGLLAGFFPDKNGPQIIDLTRRIQTSLKEKTQKTITAGVAEYPTLRARAKITSHS